MPRERHLLRVATGILVLAAVIAVPALLVAVARWPLPSRMPNWDRVATAIRQGDLPGAVVIKSLACVLWIVWLQFVWAITWEFAAQIRYPHDPPADHAAPLVPRTVHRSVGRLVAFVLAAGITITSTPSTAFAMRTGSVAASAPPPHPPPAATASVDPQTAATVWVVCAGDTVWDIAEQALGDGGRSGEILELNPTVQPRRLRVGYHLTLPADAVIPNDRQPTSPALTDAAPDEPSSPTTTIVIDTAGYLPPETITIRTGDNLWSLAEARLDAADGTLTPSAAETADYLDDVIDSNSFPSGDPSLIHPGEQYQFPAIGTPPPPVSEQVPAPSEPEPTATGIDPAPTPDPTPVATTNAPSTTTPTRPSEPAPGPTTVVTTPARPATTPTSSGSTDATDTAPLLAGIAGATALATGLLLAHRRRRQHAARRGAAALRRPVPARQRQLVDQLVRAADVPLVRWANHELATLMAGLDPRAITGTPLAVEISTSHGIELLWSDPNPGAPHPWEAADGGWTWRLLYDPDHPTQHDPEIAPIAGLVTVGTRDGNQLLLNLEAFGTVALTGDPARAENLARAVVLELAATQELGSAFCTVVGVPVDGDEHFWRAEHTDIETARQRITSQQASYRTLIRESGLPGAFHLRVGDPFDRDVTVAVLDAAATSMLDETEVEPNLGVAVLALGPVAGNCAAVSVDADGKATLQPLGLQFDAAGVPLATAAAIAVLLDEPENPVVGTDPLIIDDPPATDSGDADADEVPAPAQDEPSVRDSVGEDEPDTKDDDDAARADPTHLVRVLGAPSIDGVSGLGRLELGIITYLACNGRIATPEQIIDAVWSGKTIGQGTFSNRLTRARNTAPGILLPRPHGTREVALADDVTTDMHLLEAAIRRAESASSGRAIDLLRDGLSYVDGVPFDDPSFDWAHDRQHHAHASTLIETAALRLIDLALEDGDIDTARVAYRQGLRGLPLNEPLYRARMRTEAAAANPVGVREAYNELVRALADLDDALGAFEPDDETRRLHERLTGHRELRPTA